MRKKWGKERKLSKCLAISQHAMQLWCWKLRQGLGSITSRCSGKWAYSCCLGKWAHTHPPKERLDACDFLCWFKPIMLPPADFRLAKIVVEIITSKQKVLAWSIAWRGDFDGEETLGEILEFWRNTTFCSIVCCEWLWLERFCIFKDLFKTL